MEETVSSIAESTNTTFETTTSAMSLLQEEMEVDDSFDVTRPERQLSSEDMENTLHDATVTDITPTAPVTYTIVDSRTERGKPKLASSDGHSFVHTTPALTFMLFSERPLHCRYYPLMIFDLLSTPYGRNRTLTRRTNTLTT
ncbi:hypothetical protein DPMN_078627 [Dreissena polymorpha]|uniref:Uncharacterized protein n=1 Tax=Dreissena polymorpha TaxID=45954 RepID=A0A9D3YMK4_DREPO|nr:hypothetical protein DPMN_078627 [Dreissena polymorpha]